MLKVKSVASKIFAEINDTQSGEHLPHILSDYDLNYWDAILRFTQLYYGVEVPEFKKPKQTHRKIVAMPEQDFSSEYEAIVKSHRAIGNSFIQLLHDYRFKRVNPANLEVEQLYYPQKLYNYLRNHHWKRGIPKEFVSDWVLEVKQHLHSNEEPLVELQVVLNKLNVPFSLVEFLPSSRAENSPKSKTAPSTSREVRGNMTAKPRVPKIERVPSVEKFQEFKLWIEQKLDQLDRAIASNPRFSGKH